MKKKPNSRVLEIHRLRAMKTLPIALSVGALAVASFATAAKGDVYLILGFDAYLNPNTDSVGKILTDEFPDHTLFLGRRCNRYCKDGMSSLGHESGGTYGVGYSLTDAIALELSWATGPGIVSTVVQAGNPVWHRTKNRASGLKLDVAFTNPIFQDFSLLGRAGLQVYSTRLTYGTYIGNYAAENLVAENSTTTKRNMTASLSGGLWFSPQPKLAVGVHLTYYVDSEFRYAHSVNLEMKVKR